MDRNHVIYKMAALLLAFSLVICAFSSCGTQDDDSVITRGTAEIEGPSETTAASSEETTGESDSTGAETTTESSILSGLTTTAAAAASDSTVNLDPEVSEAVNEAASSGGTDSNSIVKFISDMGFEYDASQGIFYTNLDNWQRSANYVSHYDTFAQYVNMHYRTAKIDFGAYDGLDWRIQLWKGQYGVFGGSEVGVYTKNPETNEMLYNCADDNHLLYMETALYLNKSDYENGTAFFTREWQAHWWLTGFKSGTVDPTTLIMRIRIRLKSRSMREMFCKALKETGFTETSSMYGGYDTYYYLGNDVYILWDDVGELNYSSAS